MKGNNIASTLVLGLTLVGLSACSSESSDAANSLVGILTGTGETAADAGTPEDNPGTVPTVIAEVTSLDVTSLDAPRGFKVFAGNEIRTVLSGTDALVEDAFFNVSFPCTGDEGVFEGFPAPQFAGFESPFTGNFTWGTASASDPEDTFRMEGTGILTGSADHDLADSSIRVNPIVNGSLIVGTAVVRQLVVSRIVQFDVCE